MTERARVNATDGSTSVRWMTPVAVSAALAAALGFALAAVPNIELITLAVFVSGAALGRLRGALVGLVGMGIYSGLGPFGSGLAIPTLFAAQLGAMALVGFAGGLLGGSWRDEVSAIRAFAAAATGFVLTSVYQAAVITGYAVTSPEFSDGFLAALAANLFFPYVHIIWNTVLFAVLVPLLVPRIRRLAERGARSVVVTVLVLAFLTVPLASVGVAQEVVPEDDATGEAPVETSHDAVVGAPPEVTDDTEAGAVPPGLEPESRGDLARRTVALPGTLSFEWWRRPLAVRRTVGLDTGVAHDAAAVLGGLPALRAVSSRWPGQHASLTRGGLPAALSTVSVGGRYAGSWLLDGLGLSEAFAVGDGVLVPSGPDLSMYSLFGSGVVAAAPGGPAQGIAAGTGATALHYHSGRRFAGTPFSRVGMGSGDAGLRWRVLEFGSGLGERGDVTGFFEGRDGRGPDTGGEYERDSFGASAGFGLASGWRVEMSGSRVTASRSVPGAVGGSGADLGLSSGAADLVLTNGRARIGVFHAASSLDDLRDNTTASCASERTGIVVDVPAKLSFLRRVRAHASGLSANGDLLTGGLRAVALGVSVDGEIRNGDWVTRVAAGASRQRDEMIPELSCLVSRPGRTGGPWLTVDAGGRFPTALELAGVERLVIGDDERLIGGQDGLESERAATFALGWALRSGRLDAGVTGEVTRVLSPVILEQDAESVLRPASGEDASATMLALWAAAADTQLGGVRVSAEVIGVDENGPLNALAPVPEFAVDASVWVDRRFFKETLDVRFAMAVSYESGLARGTWEGDLDDAIWRTQVRAEGAVGPAHLLLVVDNPLDTDSGGWPGYDFSEPRVTYAFIWDFWN